MGADYDQLCQCRVLLKISHYSLSRVYIAACLSEICPLVCVYAIIINTSISAPTWLATLFADAFSTPHQHPDCEWEEECRHDGEEAKCQAGTRLLEHRLHEKRRRIRDKISEKIKNKTGLGALSRIAFKKVSLTAKPLDVSTTLQVLHERKELKYVPNSRRNLNPKDVNALTN